MLHLLETSFLPTRGPTQDLLPPPPGSTAPSRRGQCREHYYCGTVHPKLRVHVYASRPSYLLMQAVHFVDCVLWSGLPRQGETHDGDRHVPEGGPYALLYPRPHPPPPHAQVAMPEVTLTHTSLVHSAPGCTTPRGSAKHGLGGRQWSRGSGAHVEHALPQWQQLGAGVRPVAHVMNAPAVYPPWPPLSFALSFVLSAVLRGMLGYPPPHVLPT